MEGLFVSNHPLIRHKVALLRDIQTEPKKFRGTIREIAILLAYEATSDLGLSPVTVTTPMGQADGTILAEKIGLVPILPAWVWWKASGK
ncbi:uracil phosphoribosyltransferase [Candidatus Amarolinea dominans]|uniref:uracil phosphoribosyltransferase n=1 Tax=Candidatus Amarolinea dominans TaxID=3140696 RepID=UPI0031CC8833